MDGYETFWSYIPHFVHSPFYVYAYAFGDGSGERALCGLCRWPAGFQEKYFDMLKAGGSKHHKELLAPFGLDAVGPEVLGQGPVDDRRLHRRVGGDGGLSTPRNNQRFPPLWGEGQGRACTPQASKARVFPRSARSGTGRPWPATRPNVLPKLAIWALGLPLSTSIRMNCTKVSNCSTICATQTNTRNQQHHQPAHPDRHLSASGTGLAQCGRLGGVGIGIGHSAISSVSPEKAWGIAAPATARADQARPSHCQIKARRGDARDH